MLASVPSTHTAVPVDIQREQVSDAAAIDALVMAAFGPGRFAKTAERVREKSAILAGFTVYDGDALLGSVRLWNVTSGAARGAFLGPIAVRKSKRSSGLGGLLVQKCIDEAKALGLDGILLIGDPPYFERFGFLPAPDSVFSGPVSKQRIMWLPITEVSPDGAVKPVA
ncbi:MAG: N-acetyltransferase [Brevundimonas sp.]